MPAYICVTCGTQYPASAEPPEHCLICEDTRQYVGFNGQQWTTLDAMRGDQYQNQFRELESGVTGIQTSPQFAIGQQACLIQTDSGNLLWDCVSYLDQATIDEVKQRGGLSAIAISHPHFYSSMNEWSHAFGDIPIYIHADDQRWVVNPSNAIEYWEGETHQVLPGLTLIRCGGHFPGSAVVHWSLGADGRGALFTSDTMTVVPDRHWLSFMFSYPNLIPLSPPIIRQIVKSVDDFAFDRIYGGWPDRVVTSDAKAAVRRSAYRYVVHLHGKEPSGTSAENELADLEV